MKSIEELFDESEATWALLQDWSLRASNPVVLLPPIQEQQTTVLFDLQVTTKSFLGTVAYYTGGIVIDNGWLRLLGAGHTDLSRTLSSWNQIDSNGKSTRLIGSFLIADDILGGFFSINGGAFSGEIGDVFYLAPDTLEWESLEMSYPDFLNWTFTGDLRKFYESFKWNGWSKDTDKINGNQGMLIYPFLWADGEDISKRSKKIVPIEELWHLNLDNMKKLGIG